MPPLPSIAGSSPSATGSRPGPLRCGGTALLPSPLASTLAMRAPPHNSADRGCASEKRHSRTTTAELLSHSLNPVAHLASHSLNPVAHLASHRHQHHNTSHHITHASSLAASNTITCLRCAGSEKLASVRVHSTCHEVFCGEGVEGVWGEGGLARVSDDSVLSSRACSTLTTPGFGRPDHPLQKHFW